MYPITRKRQEISHSTGFQPYFHIGELLPTRQGQKTTEWLRSAFQNVNGSIRVTQLGW